MASQIIIRISKFLSNSPGFLGFSGPLLDQSRQILRSSFSKLTPKRRLAAKRMVWTLMMWLVKKRFGNVTHHGGKSYRKISSKEQLSKFIV